MRRIAEIVKVEAAILRRDWFSMVTVVLIPLLTMAVLRAALRPTLATLGYEGATGAEQVVPGIAVLFAIFQVEGLAFPFFRDHFEHTWDRLRASATTREIILGKLAIPVAVFVWQQVLLWTIGSIVFDLALGGRVFAVVVISACYVGWLTTVGLLVMAVSRSQPQLHAVAQLLTSTGALAGTLVPLASLPGWIQAVAPIIPPYWAMRAYRTVLLDDGSLADALPSLAVLGLFALGSLALFTLRFDPASPKAA